MVPRSEEKPEGNLMNSRLAAPGSRQGVDPDDRPSAPPPRAPNILLVLTDDQGPWALGRHCPELVTPTLDRLAAEGTCLDRFFCASPVCSPARASLLTGRMPSAHGVHDWLLPEAVSSPDSRYLDGVPTLAETLATAGYRCGLAGKWHVGTSREPAPGYEYWYAHRLGGGPYHHAPIWEFDERTGRTAPEPDERTEPLYFTDAIGDHAVDFLRRHAFSEGDGRRPFFLQLTPTAPHDPWTEGNHPEELLALYEDTDFPSVPTLPPDPWFRQDAFTDAVENRHRNLAGYAAAVSGVDRMLERVMDELEVLDVLKDTIIVFTSDNGFSCGHHGIWGKGNGTFPLNFWENSIRVPFIAWGPGRIAAGRVSEELVSAVSLYETLLEIAGVDAPPDPLRCGRSVARLLRTGEELSNPTPQQVFVLDEYGDNRMIRTRRWKYVRRRTGPDELYDLIADPDEQVNRSADPVLAEVREELATRLEENFALSSDPDLDGAELPVFGLGQRRPLGPDDPAGAFARPSLAGSPPSP